MTTVQDFKAIFITLASPYSDRRFRSFFGMPLKVIADIWNHIKTNEKATRKNLLLVMHFLKVYPKETQGALLWGFTEKTYRQRVRIGMDVLNVSLPEVN